jgi:hypothetical protein
MQPTGYVYFEKRENCWYARVTLTDEKGRRRNLKKKAKDKADAEEKLRVRSRVCQVCVWVTGAGAGV